MKIERIESCPIAFANFKNKFNDAADVLEAAMQFTSNDGSLTITQSDNGTDFSVPSGGGGGGSGLPSGYGPEEWTVYDGGVVTTRNFLTDNPD